MAKKPLAGYDRICRKLDLPTSDHVLEIGNCRGGFASHDEHHFVDPA
jgi:cyclopropane fatty-acyl-phospholipid synthase-like methyltransferase